MKYPIGIQTFSQLREQGYLYIDKTKLIYQMVSQGKAYFLSRPRRFGKSLLLSTLESLFNGNKDLFNELDIAKTDYDFQQYAVITLEFSRANIKTEQDFNNFILRIANFYAEQNDIEFTYSDENGRFEELVIKLQRKTKQRVVILIDEYDKIILDNLLSPELSSLKQALSSFYAQIKSLDKYTQFIFVTGVSKFAKVSIFSGMNNLNDISQNQEFATICGVTQQELEQNFSDSIEDLSQQLSQPKQALLDKIKLWYNGYYFDSNSESVYNPHSLLSLFRNKQFKNYWYATGTPTFLMTLLQEKQFDLSKLNNLQLGINAFNASEPEKIGVLSLLFQSGYLTICGYNEPLYSLNFPNLEVKESFYESIVSFYGHLEEGEGTSFNQVLLQSLKLNDLQQFIDTLTQFFANIPYDISIKHEKYYQTLFYAIFTLLGMSIEVEVSTNIGRIDCVITTQNHIYIIEFKIDANAQTALEQIETKKYPQKYLNQNKQIVLLGVSFDSQSRNITDHKIQLS